ncbi:hypothetical protein [Sphingomonas sp. Leaf257]|uniref:hypothetical protein n=1 Tax=Sphingomonas sp. Leaf257 TaxID=1736309 RepID=UPI0006F3C3FF|nr:hypothetical protein [Sphingomonas sp. Leaf257]KQO50504.1 hypothetical protein ASF14_10380 [Sphingomonas sp. Leaf257]
MTPYRPAPSARPAPRLAPCILIIGLTLAGCARDHDTTPYPSLAVRPVEKQGFAEPAAKPVVLRPDPALDAQVAEMTRRLTAVEQEFTKAHDQARTDAAKARGAAVGSEAWLTAQTELATLDEIRARTSSLLTEIDDRAIQRAAALEPDYPTLTSLRDRASAAVTRQAAQIKAISDSLPAA